jgi:hypothetical protein
MWHAWERRGKCISFFAGKSEGKRPFERPRSKWVCGSRIDVREIG